MAKKKTSKNNKKNPRNTVPENSLPQNIVPMGERVEEDKNIYISQPVYKEIHKFTKNKTTDESGGMLVGSVIEEFGKTNIIISGFVEAKFCEATPTTLTFTHKTWEYCHKEIDKKYPGKKIVGWIHTHPNFGIFLSEYDKFIQQNFFSDSNQIAYVVDPIQNIEGFYFWINGNIERCKGFYIYDKTGVKITVNEESEQDAKDNNKNNGNKAKGFDYKTLVICILSILVAFLIFSNYSLKKDFEEYKEETHQTFVGLQYQINTIISAFNATQQPAEDETEDKDNTNNNNNTNSSNKTNTANKNNQNKNSKQ